MRDATLSLLLDWAALMALSLVLGFAGQVGDPAAGLSRPGAISLVVIALAAAFKARIILRNYLGLVRAPGAAAGFFAAVFTVLALVCASFLIFPTPARICGGKPAFVQTFAGGTE